MDSGSRWAIALIIARGLAPSLCIVAAIIALVMGSEDWTTPLVVALFLALFT